MTTQPSPLGQALARAGDYAEPGNRYRPALKPTIDQDLAAIIDQGFRGELADRLGRLGRRPIAPSEPPGDIDAVAEYIWQELLTIGHKYMLASTLLRAYVVAEHKRLSGNQP